MKTNLIPCPACAQEVSPNAPTCPPCGEVIKKPQSATGVFAAILIALIIGGVLFVAISGAI